MCQLFPDPLNTLSTWEWDHAPHGVVEGEGAVHPVIQPHAHHDGQASASQDISDDNNDTKMIDWQVSNVRMGRQKSLLDHCSMLNGDWMIDLKMKPHWFIIAPDIQLLKKPDIRPNMQLGLHIRGQQLSHTRNANGTDVCLCLLRRTKYEFV